MSFQHSPSTSPLRSAVPSTVRVTVLASASQGVSVSPAPLEELGVGGGELGDLGFAEDGHLGLLKGGPVDRVDGVGSHLPPLDRPFDHHPQQGEVVGDCFGGEPCRCFGGDVGVDQLRSGFR